MVKFKKILGTIKRNLTFPRIIWYLCMLTVCLVVLLPVFFAISASFHTNKEIMLGTFSIIPDKLDLSNYKRVWEYGNFAKYTWNSVYFAGVSTIGTVVVVSMAAYAFARYEFPGKKVIFGILCTTMFFSAGTAGLFQTMKIANFLHINNSLNGVVIMNIFGAHITYMYLVKNFLASIPKEMDEAAIIDGAGFYQIYSKIMLPMMSPILFTVAIMSFKSSWNSYLLPMIFTITTPEKAPLAVAIQALKSSGAGAANWDIQTAATVITMLPMIILFCLFSKYFTGGLTEGAVKG